MKRKSRFGLGTFVRTNARGRPNELSRGSRIARLMRRWLKNVDRPPITVDNYLTVPLKSLSPGEWDRLFKRMSYTDNEFNTHEPWRILTNKGAVRLPRGAWSLLPDHIRYVDKRSCPEEPLVDFMRTLDGTVGEQTYTGQRAALKAMLREEQGLIVAQPGFGKTNVALAFISVARTKTLVLVHTHDLLQQWVENAEDAVPGMEVGVIAGQIQEVCHLTISTVQTFHKLMVDDPAFWKRQFGCIILDEAHHAAASTFEEILNRSAARFRFGFTATPTRSDGKHPYMRLVIGPIIYRHKFELPVPAEVVALKSGFKMSPGYRGRHDWRRLLDTLIRDPERNALIASTALREIAEGNTVLILSSEKEHLRLIYEAMGSPKKVEILTADRKKKDRDQVLKDFRRGKVVCVLATQLANEGLDVPRLNRIMLTYPAKHDGGIIQKVGRTLRKYKGKKNAIVYDMVDDKIRPLKRQWSMRLQAYRHMGIPLRQRKGLFTRG